MFDALKLQARRLWADEEGATMVEYALLLALVGAVAIGVVTTVGKKAINTFNTVNNAMPQ